MMDKKQQRLIDEFFKKNKMWRKDSYLATAGLAFFIFIMLVLNLVPFFVLEGDTIKLEGGIYSIIFALVTFWIYMGKYMHFVEGNKYYDISMILSSLPISRKQLNLYRMKKAFEFALKITALCLVFQCLIILTVGYDVVIPSIIGMVVANLVIPMVLFGITCFILKS